MAKILIADDDEMVRRNIMRSLKNQGHKLLEATDGQAAIEIIQKEKIDVLIIDVVMPKLGGTETLIRYKKELENTKVIVVSGKISEESDAFQMVIKQFGANRFLQKPFLKNQLIEAIQSVLEQ
ncbi:MAG: response regulator [Spirochaetes bacterium]|nr:response regulator [Spirochaetota bacterium]